MSADLNEQVAVRLGWIPFIKNDLHCTSWFRPNTPKNRREWTMSQPLPNWQSSRDLIARDLLPVLTEEQWDVFAERIWDEVGEEIPLTDMGGFFRRILTASPETLVKSWLAATEKGDK